MLHKPLEQRGALPTQRARRASEAPDLIERDSASEQRDPLVVSKRAAGQVGGASDNRAELGISLQPVCERLEPPIDANSVLAQEAEVFAVGERDRLVAGLAAG